VREGGMGGKSGGTCGEKEESDEECGDEEETVWCVKIGIVGDSSRSRHCRKQRDQWRGVEVRDFVWEGSKNEERLSYVDATPYLSYLTFCIYRCGEKEECKYQHAYGDVVR